MACLDIEPILLHDLSFLRKNFSSFLHWKLFSKSLPHENNAFHFKEIWIVNAVHYMNSGWWWDIGEMLFLGLQTIHENCHAKDVLLNINVFMAKEKYHRNTWSIFIFLMTWWSTYLWYHPLLDHDNWARHTLLWFGKYWKYVYLFPCLILVFN